MRPFRRGRSGGGVARRRRSAALVADAARACRTISTFGTTARATCGTSSDPPPARCSAIANVATSASFRHSLASPPSAASGACPQISAQSHGPVLRPGAVRPQRQIRMASRPSRAVHGLAISPRATRRNASSSARYASSKRVRKRGPGRAGHRGAVGSSERSGVRAVSPTADRVPRADDLHPDVVAQRVVARLAEHGERSVAQAEDRAGRVHVVVLARRSGSRAPSPLRRPPRPPGR